MSNIIQIIINEIKTLLLRGNVVDLMVAVVFGTALASFIRSVVHDIFLPVFSIIISQRDLSNMKYQIYGISINYGAVINNFIIFLVTTLVLIFLFIKPFNEFIKL
jgi:large conductance mechanosensitive channel